MSEVTVKLDHETVDKIIYDGLKDTMDRFLQDLSRDRPNIFIWADTDEQAAEDKAEIQKYVDALELILDWYKIPE